MKRSYNFEWYKNKENKYGNAIIRHTVIYLPSCTGKTEEDAKKALEIFMRNNGSLKKVTVNRIKEFDENNKQIGKDITPMEGKDAIIPIAR